MALDHPRFVPRSELLGLRPHPPDGLLLGGLWVVGDLGGLRGKAVAVVGCRAPSHGGRELAYAMARGLAEAGLCVVSGLALGIDGSAHAGALAGGGTTLGVLGGGHRHFYPRRNRALAEAMVGAGGAVVSPFAPDEPARPWQFLARNAVVAGFCDAVVVVEAAARSGALNTAGWAGGRGIDVFAVPGDVDRAKAAGCNQLIRDGATLVRDAADVLTGLGLASEPDPAARPATREDPLEAAVLAALRGKPSSFETLLERCAGEPGALLGALVRLELAGLVVRREDLRYARL